MDGQTDRARTWGQRAPGSAGLGTEQAKAASRGVLMPPRKAAGRARHGWSHVAGEPQL